MVNHHGCIDGRLQGIEKYSAPVPVIGLYIAAASAVCALIMLYDIAKYGFLKKQKWLPCKWFKLNSVTLSFIGVVVKLTVDITTSMPSALDQLSKLTGTTSLCIYMCYIYPSIQDMKDSTNMFALSILVITVFVNICIQLSTGVIVLFFPEHIIIMCIMLVLLVILLRIALLAKNERRDSVATGKSDFMTGEKLGGMREESSFLQRLKNCYLKSYKVNPQFRACRREDCGPIGDLSVISVAILIQAAIRSVALEKVILCTGSKSDYQWSMGLIVTTQFFFIITGTFASHFRRWTMLVHLDLDSEDRKLIEEPYCSNPMLKGKFRLVIVAENVYLKIISLNRIIDFFFFALLNWIASSMRTLFSRVFTMVKYYTSSEEERLNADKKFESFGDYIDRLEDSNVLWIKRKSENSMEKLIEGSKQKSKDFCNQLSSIIPTDKVLGNFEVLLNSPYRGPSTKIELLHARLHPLVVLVRLVEVAIPEIPSQARIVKTFMEAFETLHFIEKHIHNTTLEDLKETEIAKALWTAGDFSRLLPVDLRSSNQFPLTVDHAFCVMKCIQKRMGENQSLADSVSTTMKHIRHFLKRKSYSSAEELGKIMEDLFVYMLNKMLAHLPDAIFKAVSQSPADEFEKQVGRCLKHFSMLQSWGGIHKWKPPQGLKNCTGLLDPEKPATPSVVFENSALVSPNNSSTSLNPEIPPVQDEGGDASIQVPPTPSEGNNILSLKEHHVTIIDDDGIVEIQSI